MDLDKRGHSDLSFPNGTHSSCRLGVIEGNVGKLVVHRMQGRGYSWRLEGAEAMLAMVRHKDDLKYHSFKYVPIQPKPATASRQRSRKSNPVYQPNLKLNFITSWR